MAVAVKALRATVDVWNEVEKVKEKLAAEPAVLKELEDKFPSPLCRIIIGYAEEWVNLEFLNALCQIARFDLLDYPDACENFRN